MKPLTVETRTLVGLRHGAFEQIVGRIIELPGGRAAFSRFAPQRPREAFTLDSCVLWQLIGDDTVGEIHFVGERLYALAKAEFWRQSYLAAGRASFAVPLADWQVDEPWYEPTMAKRTLYAVTPVPLEGALCWADRGGGSNYRKPHVARRGVYDGAPRDSCAFCGRWLDASADSAVEGSVEGTRHGDG